MTSITFESPFSDREKNNLTILIRNIVDFFGKEPQEVRVHRFGKSDIHFSFLCGAEWLIINIRHNESAGVIVNGDIKSTWIE